MIKWWRKRRYIWMHSMPARALYEIIVTIEIALHKSGHGRSRRALHWFSTNILGLFPD